MISLKNKKLLISSLIIFLFVLSTFSYAIQACQPNCEYSLKGAEAKSKKLVETVMCKGLPCTDSAQLGTSCCSATYGGKMGLTQVSAAGNDAGCTNELCKKDLCTLNRDTKYKPAWEGAKKDCKSLAQECNTNCQTCEKSCKATSSTQVAYQNCVKICNQDLQKCCKQTNAQICVQKLDGVYQAGFMGEMNARIQAALAGNQFMLSSQKEGSPESGCVPTSEIKDWGSRNPDAGAVNNALNDMQKGEQLTPEQLQTKLQKYVDTNALGPEQVKFADVGRIGAADVLGANQADAVASRGAAAAAGGAGGAMAQQLMQQAMQAAEKAAQGGQQGGGGGGQQPQQPEQPKNPEYVPLGTKTVIIDGEQMDGVQVYHDKNEQRTPKTLYADTGDGAKRPITGNQNGIPVAQSTYS